MQHGLCSLTAVEDHPVGAADPRQRARAGSLKHVGDELIAWAVAGAVAPVREQHDTGCWLGEVQMAPAG